ncbi:MAG: alpha/beta hydrolase [Clostridia bacterium]|nr:alpha/beta hydrolase [Clostridia bacterium]
MLFEPSYEYRIIKEEDFPSKILEITDVLNKHINQGYFTSFDGQQMYYEFFRVAKPQANIVLVHGYTEFAKKYYELVWYFMSMGYNVFLYDVRGHGNSYRLSDDMQMTHVDKYEDYVEDLDAFIKQIVITNGDDAPVYLFGHSMGGAIAQMYISTKENPVSKTVLSAPMVYPYTPPLPGFVLKKLIAREAKKFGWDARFKFSSEFNPEAELEKSNDLSYTRFRYNLDTRINNVKYRNSYGSNRWTYETLCVAKKILNKKAISNVKCDVLIIIAGKDTAVNPKYQKKLAKKLGCECKIFANSKHSLYTLPDNQLSGYVDALIEFCRR